PRIRDSARPLPKVPSPAYILKDTMPKVINRPYEIGSAGRGKNADQGARLTPGLIVPTLRSPHQISKARLPNSIRAFFWASLSSFQISTLGGSDDCPLSSNS